MSQKFWRLLTTLTIALAITNCASTSSNKTLTPRSTTLQHNFFPVESQDSQTSHLPLLHTDFELSYSYQLPEIYQPLQQATLLTNSNLLWPIINDTTYNLPQLESVTLTPEILNQDEATQILLHYRYNAYASELLQSRESVPPELLQKRQSSIYMANQVLNEFLANNPDMAPEFEHAAGYAVIDITSFNALLYVGGWGYGVLFDNVNQKAFYIDYFRTGTGFGLGYISEYEIIMFDNHASINQFIGASAGADIGASGTVGIWTKYYSFNPTIHNYHIYQYGANIQANWGGTLFWTSPSLN